jgi:hypothetical protein
MCCRFAPDLFGPPDGLEHLAEGKVLAGFALLFLDSKIILDILNRLCNASHLWFQMNEEVGTFPFNNPVDTFVLAVWGPTNIEKTVL